MDFLSLLFKIKILLCLFFLAAASRQDLKTRTVSDSIWIKLLFCSLPILIIETYFLGISHVISIVGTVFLMFAISAALFYFRIFGGADTKALICLSILFPEDPISFFESAAMTTLMNSVIFIFVLPIFLLLKNIKNFKQQNTKPALKELPLFLIGCKTDILKLTAESAGKQKINGYPLLMERYDFSNSNTITSKKIVLTGIDFRNEDEQRYVRKLRQMIRRGKISRMGWVTPGIPYLIPLTAGFLISVEVGNLFLKIVLILFKYIYIC
ncbi:hypothetical protein MsAg5_08220 [Methanosarcinaceae archaeon Ag5]|uniref:Preflagellin peptidase C-terminal domain-containing protein n=1 Tax=Methanolapillus africanus TaxID=3028297 RepID=A0AAE4MIR8_9EURY|nr:hypothetical protein [Methanosarcinaceae archaeon Ag5]